MKFAKSTLITFITNIFIFGISVMTTIVTARVLGPTGNGVLGIANNSIALLILLLGFGMESSNIFYIGKDRKNVRWAIGANLTIAFFASIALIIFYLLDLKFQFKFLKGLNNPTVMIVFLTVPLSSLKSTSISILLGLQEVIQYNKINMIDKSITFLLMMVFIFSMRSPYWVLTSNMISIIVVLMILFYILYIKNRFKISFKPSLFKEMVSYGNKNQIGNIIQLLNYRLDVFIINYFLPLAQVGIYSKAVALGETMWQVSGSVATVVYPMTTNSKDKLEMSKFINKVTRITLYIVMLCSIVLVVISKPFIVALLGKAYTGSAYALIYLIPGISIFSISKIIANYIAGVGKVEKNIIASAVSLVATVTLDLLLIPRIGIIGASIATSVSYILFTVIIIYFYIGITKASVLDLIILRREDINDVKVKIMSMIKKKNK